MIIALLSFTYETHPLNICSDLTQILQLEDSTKKDPRSPEADKYFFSPT